MDGALCVPLSAGPAAGATACPKAGVAAAAAKITNSRKVRRTMLSSLRQRRAYLLKHGPAISRTTPHRASVEWCLCRIPETPA